MVTVRGLNIIPRWATFKNFELLNGETGNREGERYACDGRWPKYELHKIDYY